VTKARAHRPEYRRSARRIGPALALLGTTARLRTGISAAMAGATDIERMRAALRRIFPTITVRASAKTSTSTPESPARPSSGRCSTAVPQRKRWA
jgi:hypothetical protein